MLSYTGNIYYDPENYGLTVLTTVELAEPDYSFDMLAVWKGPEGFYLATDSGCSCPSPFENYGGIDDLTGPLTAADAICEMMELWNGYDPLSFASALRLIVD